MWAKSVPKERYAFWCFPWELKLGWVNSYGTRPLYGIYSLYPHGARWQCTTKRFILAGLDAYTPVLVYVKSDMNHVILVPKKFDLWSKKCHFRFISGEISAEKFFFWKNFIAPKDSSLNFRGSLLGYFWAIVRISAVISILEDFGSLLPARSVTVKAPLGHGGSSQIRKTVSELLERFRNEK